MKKPSLYGMLIALTFILSYVEFLLPLPWIIVPGIKLGLPNVVILFTLYRYTGREAAIVSGVRILLFALTFGSISLAAYSAGGALLSIVAMTLARKAGVFSIAGVSMLGGVCHNIGQMIVAILVLQTPALLYYSPILITVGALTGILIGLVCRQVLMRMPKRRGILRDQ
ncbi:MAG: Gx transporter family protein [Eubacteriales bacterium]|nr:Gx transporter family protein [Eubacteriales bacterium]